MSNCKLEVAGRNEIGQAASASLPAPDSGWLIQTIRQAELATMHHPLRSPSLLLPKKKTGKLQQHLGCNGICPNLLPQMIELKWLRT
jgi:hypothetical protein